LKQKGSEKRGMVFSKQTQNNVKRNMPNGKMMFTIPFLSCL